MSELPNGWAKACIGDLADLNPKQAFDDETLAGFVPMSHAPTNFRDKLRFDERPWGEIKKAYTNFKDGDVIFAKVTPCFENGKAAFVDGLPNGVGAGSSEFFVLRPNCEGVSAKYLLALVKSHDFLREGAENMTGAVGLRRVPKQFVERYLVPVPPAAEQTRITAKLDELLAQVDTLKARINAIPALLKRFRQSVLAAAVSGQLTEEWRLKIASADHSAYPEVPLDSLADFQNGFAFKSDWFSKTGDIQVAKIGNVRNGKVDLDNSPAFVSYEVGSEYQRFMTSEGDILLSMTGTKYKRDYGNACSAPAGILVNQRVGKLRPQRDKVDGRFLLLCLQTAGFREQFFSGETGQVSQGNVGSEHIKKCLIPSPPIEEQAEIVYRTAQLFAFAEQVEAKVVLAKSRVDHLAQSILAKAFRGELVPQDPNDEPASVLLERIKAQRAAMPKAKRGRQAAKLS
ncbi:restriction endonuclease subunit S [Pseudomonas ficuserectae]|uniref:restriction endonuclease subunit S n=1 Tax=Pseudomonas ficuserectae TaxID=53410 RepID=UPI0006D5E6E5|nr:restriction endonuclease subunit S [Pseudomonas ficuserectae]KPX41440.1 Type I restriction endonuclease EcoAI [Pseudomonas ficuserectae]RMS38129.1 Type I restriction endonuclease EcoAI [Pseudomonas ficuserectae]